MSSKIITYLSALEQNNNKEWYHAHKDEYKEANGAFEDIIKNLILEIGKYDDSILFNEAKNLTFKLQRDTRFSHDKSPYNPAFRCHIAARGKLPVPVGYFLFVSPGGRSFLGGGLFADMFKDATDMVRNYIVGHGEELKEIITAPEFKEYFKVEGNALKNVPKGYDARHPQAEYLKNKSWFIEYHFEDSLLDDSDAFIQYAAEKFRRMKPFNDYLNKALKDFQMPQR